MTKTNNIPKEWKWVKFEDLLDYIQPTKYIVESTDYNDKYKTPVLTAGKSFIIGYTNENEGIFNSLPVIIFDDFTTANKFVNFPFKVKSSAMKILKPKSKDVNILFVFYYMQTVKISFDTHKRYWISVFSKLPVPLPPLPVQQAIVSKIEELFSELDNGIAQLKTAQQQLKTYRQSVLKWAFEGKLTEEWRLVGMAGFEPTTSKNKKSRKSINPTNHGLDNKLNAEREGFEPPDLPEGWKWVKSGDLFSFVTSGSRGWAKYYSNDGAIFIRITNMDFNTLDLDLRESSIQYVNPPLGSEGIRTKIQEGDFLFSITGYLGMFAIAPKLDNAFVNQHVCLCRPIDGFNKKYVGYWIISESGGIHYLNKNKKGAVKAGLNLDDLKSFPVPICSLEEQHQIVQEIESRLSVADKLEESISASLQQAEALRQSILKRAFEGRLI